LYMMMALAPAEAALTILVTYGQPPRRIKAIEREK
jgi:hypothetical protein